MLDGLIRTRIVAFRISENQVCDGSWVNVLQLLKVFGLSVSKLSARNRSERLGHFGELRGKVGVNSLWPRTAIDTAAMAEFKPPVSVGALRSPQILADAAYLVLTSDAKTTREISLSMTSCSLGTV